MHGTTIKVPKILLKERPFASYCKIRFVLLKLPRSS
jgi:hypothetical protein